MAAPRPLPATRPDRAGVIDIGSNSVRLVAFDLRFGPALPLFNEKAICRLGEELPDTGRLGGKACALALASLTRFRTLADALDLDALFVLATSAVRDAENGASFVAAAAAIFESQITVLGGEEEARVAAEGVVAGLPEADGVAGDLGGGSLELAAIADGRTGAAASLPLGPLRRRPDGGAEEIQRDIAQQLAAVPWLRDLEDRTFFAVGGAWRALANVRMAKVGHPLRMIHGYTIDREEAEALIRQICKSSPDALARLPGVSGQRAATLPYAAQLLAGVLQRGRPADVCFSAYGLREGYLHDRLRPLDGRDPLDAAIDWMTRYSEVDDRLTDALMTWSEPLFSGESRSLRRLRRAACRLSNLAWHEHPDYRGRQAFEAVLRGTALPVRHVERAFLALTTLHRYGAKQVPEAAAIETILPGRLARRTRVLGLALRLAWRIAGSSEALLAGAGLRIEGSTLRLVLPAELDAGEIRSRDLQALARAADLTAIDENDGQP